VLFFLIPFLVKRCLYGKVPGCSGLEQLLPLEKAICIRSVHAKGFFTGIKLKWLLMDELLLLC